MAAWLPIIKTAIPVIAEIVAVTRPMFTKKPDNQRDELTARQIEELQNAATQNAASVQELAAQVKTTFEGMESAAVALQARLVLQQKICVAALVLSAVSLACSVFLVAGA